MQKIWLVRHGESSLGTDGAFSAFGGVPLTQQGYQQAHQVAALFVEPPAVVVTSPYLRAQQTAEATLQRFPHLPCEAWPIQEFTYLTFPTNRAVTKAELQPQAEAYWRCCNPAYCDGPQAESFQTFIQRVQHALARLQQRSEPFLVLFTHELFLSAVVWVLLTQPTEITAVQMQQFHAFAKGVQWPHCAILPLAMDSDLWMGGVMTGHLSVPSEDLSLDSLSRH